MLLDKSVSNFLVIKPLESLSENGVSIVNKTESSKGFPVIHLINIQEYIGANVVRAHARCACEGGRSCH